MGELGDALRVFWFDLFNSRAMDEMRARFHPDYEQVDHRALTVSGGDRDEWAAWTRTWWEMVPDLVVREFEVLAEEGEHVAYLIVFAGHDAVTGGDMSGAFYVVGRYVDGQARRTELFDDRAAALARFAELCRPWSDAADR